MTGFCKVMGRGVHWEHSTKIKAFGSSLCVGEVVVVFLVGAGGRG